MLYVLMKSHRSWVHVSFLCIIALIFSAYGSTAQISWLRYSDTLTLGLRPVMYQLISARRANFR